VVARRLPLAVHACARVLPTPVKIFGQQSALFPGFYTQKSPPAVGNTRIGDLKIVPRSFPAPCLLSPGPFFFGLESGDPFCLGDFVMETPSLFGRNPSGDQSPKDPFLSSCFLGLGRSHPKDSYRALSWPRRFRL